MQQLIHIEPPATFVVRPGPAVVALVGCGGTGSHIAQALARIAVHAAQGGQEPRLIFIDGDEVEEKNVGRQLFTPHDVGRNKAMALAERFGRLFGLRIEAIPEMATIDVLKRLWPKGNPFQHEQVGILVGAVDSAVARKTMHAALGAQPWAIWLDAGNHEYAGQVSVGTASNHYLVKPAVAGLCTSLPAPSLIDPEILEATPPKRRADCAAAVEDNLQGLMVNTQVAAVAAVYLERLIIRRQLQTFRTSFTQDGTLSMNSDWITNAAIAKVLRKYQEYLEEKKEKAA